MYTASADGSVKAFNAGNQEEQWKSTDPFGSAPRSLTPAPDDQYVYVGDDSGTVTQLSADSGDSGWTWDSGSSRVEGLATSPDGEMIVAGTHGNEVVALDADTGDVIWSDGDEHTDRVYETSFSPEGDIVFSSSSSGDVIAYDADSGDHLWTNSDATVSVRALAAGPNGDYVYAGDSNDQVRALHVTTGSQEWVNGGHTDRLFTISPSVDGTKIFTGSRDSTVRSIKTGGGDEMWSTDEPTGDVWGVATSVDSETVFAGGDDSILRAYNTDSGDLTWDIEAHDDQIRDVTTLGTIYTDVSSITGQVVDQHGDPVEQDNITVEAWGVDEPALDEADLGELEDDINSARDLADELENSVPEDYDEFTDDFEADDGRLDTREWDQAIDGTYPLVHQSDDWSVGTATVISSSVDDPRVRIDEGERVTISLWDPDEGGWVENQVDNSFPGAVTEGTIVVEQMDPLGETIDTRTLETTPKYETTGANPLSTNEHHVAEARLPVGIYQAYPEGERAKAYTFVVGDPDDIAADYAQDLWDRADRLEQRYDMAENALDDVVVRERTTTNATGHFEVNAPAGPDEYSIQAYKGDEEVITALNDLRDENLEDPSFDDLRLEDIREYSLDGANQSWLLPAETGTVYPEQQDAEVQVIRSDEIPWDDMEAYDDWRSWLEDELLNESVADLEGFDELPEEWTDENLTEIHDNYTDLLEENDHLQDELEDALDREVDVDVDYDDPDLNNDELVDEIETLEETLRTLEDRIDAGDGETEIGEETIRATFPFASDLEPDGVTVLKHPADGGDPTAVADEHWHIESSGVLAGDQVVVEYPTEELDTAVGQFEVVVANDEGVGRSDQVIQNPAFEGLVPDIQAISLNTHSPGPSEQVAMTVRPADGESIDGITDVTAYDPDGNTIAGEVRADDRATFTTNGAGVHHVKLTVASGSGDEFVQAFKVRALEDGRSDDPTIRVADSASGSFALAGEGLRNAAIEREDDRLAVRGVVPADEVPGSIHVKPGEAMTGADGLTVRVLEGTDQRQVSSNIETVVHLDRSLDADAAVWRGDPAWFGANPLAVDDTTRHGEVQLRGEDGEKTVIRTYTDSDGTIDLTIDPDPGIVAGLQHSLAMSLPSPSLPILSVGAIHAATAGLTVGLGLFTRRRVAA
ncbi:hypothetical protein CHINAEXTREME_20550 (plasmid) [Halobiforma lacisalsi AJ5]|uniref:Pyrrolo-quinoline quinone repeat domain-containing protein n=1 Tax=Natronobacterium lacisalsi AJ5 TaxID=358396 RepID=A0A1P8LWZ0_NATLA|nr:hypothetical protein CHINAEXTREME_20550 [Halobiforma lacisalsi AJ5]